MTTATPEPGTTASESSGDGRRSRWPLVGTVAGIGGLVATFLTDARPQPPDPVAIDRPGLIDSVDRVTAHIGFLAGFLTVAALIVLAAAWRRRVEPRVPTSTASRVVSAGFAASAAALTLGYGWKGALALYLPGGLNAGSYDTTGLYVYLVLNDFGAFIGWLGVTIAAGAVAWMALWERLVSRWIGALSVVPVLVTAGMGAVIGLPGAPALTGPLWMVVAFIGLAFGRSTIVR